jgi:hypothetical protein
VVATFAFTFYATLLAIDRPRRAVSWAALLTITASICFLTVTLGTTFAPTQVPRIEDRASLPPALRQQLPLLSTLFLAGILLLLVELCAGRLDPVAPTRNRHDGGFGRRHGGGLLRAFAFPAPLIEGSRL